jgi:hypothetical protein
VQIPGKEQAASSTSDVQTCMLSQHDRLLLLLVL